jgi:hypothetical protein
MPAVRTIVSILKKAGCFESRVVPAVLGRKAKNVPGFTVRVSPMERRVAHVFHVGRGTRLALTGYEAALKAAGFIVAGEHGGLRVTSRRKIADRIHK